MLGEAALRPTCRAALYVLFRLVGPQGLGNECYVYREITFRMARMGPNPFFFSVLIPNRLPAYFNTRLQLGGMARKTTGSPRLGI